MATAIESEEEDSCSTSSTFDLRHCLLLNTDGNDNVETMHFMDQHFEDLTSRHGNNSKILILTGSHGDTDGTDAMEDDDMLDPVPFTSLCDKLGTTHREDDFYTNRINFQCINPWTEEEEFVVQLDYRQFELIKRLREKLHRTGAQVQILNVANFVGANGDGGSENLVRTIRDCDPTAVIVTWCYSKEGFTARLLTAAGLFPKLVLRNERILLTGNKDIQLDEDQSSFLNQAAKLIKKHYRKTSKKGIKRPGLRFVLEGDPGTGKTLLALEVVWMLRAARGLSDADVLVWIGDSRQQELKERIAEMGDLREATYGYPGENVLSEVQCLNDILWDALSDRLTNKNHKILLVDEFQELYPTQFEPRMKLIEAHPAIMDLVICMKPKSWGLLREQQGEHPDNMMSMRLRTPHRQGYQPLKFWQFLGFHDKRHGHPDLAMTKPRPLAASDLPPSDSTLWIVLPKEVDLHNAELISELVTQFVDNAVEKKILFCLSLGRETEHEMNNRYHDSGWKFLDPASIHGIETEANYLKY